MIREKRDKFPSFFIFVLILVLIGVLTAFGKESYRRYQLDKEVNDYKKGMELLKGKNEVLSNFLNYFNSEKFLEREARLKLNLVKEGERLVIISPKEKTATESQYAEDIRKKQGSNFKKWLKYFGILR